MTNRLNDIAASIRCHLHYLFPFLFLLAIVGWTHAFWTDDLIGLIAFSTAVLLCGINHAINTITEYFDSTTFETDLYEDPCCCGHPGFPDVEDEVA